MLSWNAPAVLGDPALKDYQIQYSTDGVNWSDISDGYSTSTTLPLTNLKAGTTYWFKVRGENGGGYGTWSSVLQFTTPPATLATVPNNFNATNITSSYVFLDWDAPSYDGDSPITDFYVEASSDSGQTWREVPHAASTATSLSVSGLAPNTNYQFRVSAVNEVGIGESSILSITTLATVASAPLNLSATNLAGTSLLLSWNLPSTNGGSDITDYSISVSKDDGTTWILLVDKVSAVRSSTISGLAKGKNYKFRVSAINAMGTSEFSEILSVSTLKTVASSPRNVSAIATGTTAVTLSWDVPADNGGDTINNYFIEYSKDSGTTWKVVSHPVSISTSLSISNLEGGTTYSFRVSAVNSVGNGDVSSTALAETLNMVTTAPTSLVSGSVTSSSLLLQWKAPNNSTGQAITDYRVEYSADNGSTWVDVSHPASNSLSMTVNGLSKGKTYKFRVSAINGAGVSPASNVVIVTTQTTVASAPSGLKLTTGSLTTTTMKFYWNAPADNGGTAITDYQIEYSKDNGKTWIVAKHAISTLPNASITGLKSKTSYLVRVKAKNANGLSATSISLAFTTL